MNADGQCEITAATKCNLVKGRWYIFIYFVVEVMDMVIRCGGGGGGGVD